MSKVVRSFEHSNAVSTQELNRIIDAPGKGSYSMAELVKEVSWTNIDGIEIYLERGSKVLINAKKGEIKHLNSYVLVNHDDFIMLRAIAYN